MINMSSQRFLKQALPLFILLLIFAAYLPCLKADFVNWDDDVHILGNLTLRSLRWENWAEIWTSTINHTYIPLTVITWAIEQHFFGYNSFVFHLDNILLHLAVTVLVIVFSKRMGLSSMAAGLAGLLFGVHPIHVESVAWATERKDVLYVFFYMMAILVYLRYLDTTRRKYFCLTVLLGMISICAKPMAVSLPLVLLILDWFRRREWTLRILTEKIFCGAFLIPIAFFTYAINSHLMEPATGKGLFIWIWCFMFYLYKFLYPWPLILFYGFPQSGNIFYLNILLFSGLLATLWVFRRNRLFVFAMAFYFVNIFFLLRFHSFLSLVSDRFMYLPSVGLCMFAAALVEKMFFWTQERRLYSHGFKIVLCSCIVIMAVMTWRQCEVWQTSVKLWSHQLKYDSKVATWLAYYKLANAYAANEHGAPTVSKFDQISLLYQKAIHLKPDFSNSYLGRNLGTHT